MLWYWTVITWEKQFFSLVSTGPGFGLFTHWINQTIFVGDVMNYERDVEETLTLFTRTFSLKCVKKLVVENDHQVCLTEFFFLKIYFIVNVG